MEIIEKIISSKTTPLNRNIIWHNPDERSLKIFGSKGWESIVDSTLTPRVEALEEKGYVFDSFYCEELPYLFNTISMHLDLIEECRNNLRTIENWYCWELPILNDKIQELEREIEYLKQGGSTSSSFFSINLPNNQVWLDNIDTMYGCAGGNLFDFGNANIIQVEGYKTPKVITFDGDVTSVEDVLADWSIRKVWVPGSVKIVDCGRYLTNQNLLYFEEGVEQIGTYGGGKLYICSTLYLPSTIKEIWLDNGGSIDNIFYNGTKELFASICNETPIINDMLYCNDYFYCYTDYSEDPFWKPEDIPANEIWYKTINGNMIELDFLVGSSDREALGADIINHIYENGKGVIVCDGPVNVNINVFSSDPVWNLSWLGIPKCLNVPMNFYFYYLQFLVIKECPEYISENLKIHAKCFVDISSTTIGLSLNSDNILRGLILRNNSGVIPLDRMHINNFDVFVPKELVNLYKQDTNWCVHNIYAIPDQYYIK